MRPLTRSLLLLRGAATALALAACAACLAAPKTDVVTMTNGDRITGEVKSLERGKLVLSTDHAETIEIEWDMVASVKSNQVMQVELNSGVIVFGSLAEGTQAGTLLVKGTS